MKVIRIRLLGSMLTVVPLRNMIRNQVMLIVLDCFGHTFLHACMHIQMYVYENIHKP